MLDTYREALMRGSESDAPDVSTCGKPEIVVWPFCDVARGYVSGQRDFADRALEFLGRSGGRVRPGWM